MNFRSDKQRRAMFANIFSNKNVDNRFALYIDRNVNRLRSDIYPSVDVDIDVNDTVLHDVLRRVSKNEESDDERNLSGINSIRREQLVDYYGEPDYTVSGTYDKKSKDIKLSPKYYNESFRTFDERPLSNVHKTLLHELRHHIDDELTLEEYNKEDIRSEFKVGYNNRFEDFARYDIDWLEGLKADDGLPAETTRDILDRRGRVILDRLQFANELKSQTTPTYEELEEYIK